MFAPTPLARQLDSPFASCAWFSSSSSSNSTDRRTYNTDRRIGASGGALVAAEGGRVSTTTNFEDLSDEAFKELTGTVEKTTADAYGFAAEALNLAAQVGEGAGEITQQALTQSQQGLAGLEQIIRAGAIVAGLYVVSRIWIKG